MIKEKGEQKYCEDSKFIVRLYDDFDRYWIDISGPLSKDDAIKLWNKKTEDGTKNTKFEDMTYYKIFAADTKMLYDSDWDDEK